MRGTRFKEEHIIAVLKEAEAGAWAQVIAEYETGALARKYIYGPGVDNPVAMINVAGSSETWYYYYADALAQVPQFERKQIFLKIFIGDFVL